MAKIGFFEAQEGVKSCNRLVFFLGTLFNMAACGYLVFNLKTTGIELSQVGIFAGIIQAVFSGNNLLAKKIEETGKVV
jgi:hypothetical protein